jgi:16S rRNA G966 N2-methylase RsmD
VEFGGYDVRPTSGKVRESFFNIIQNSIYGAKFLDLFCGTGAMGIEALSRGASKVQFNDRSRESLSILRKNLDKLKVEEDYIVTNLDALALFFLLFSKVSKACSILCLISSILGTGFLSPGFEVVLILDLPYVYFGDFVGDPSAFLGPVIPK